jgi:DNA-binding NarL/FixJ family response regulator
MFKMTFNTEKVMLQRKSKMSLFIADDNVSFRTRLSSILSNIEGINIVGMAGNARNTAKAIKRLQPDIVILDLHMIGGSGFDVLRTIKSLRPNPAVIMLTIGSKSEYKALSYLDGADYFFEKSKDMKEMIEMLENSVKETNNYSSKTKVKMPKLVN